MASDLTRNTEIIAADLHEMADMLHRQATPVGHRYRWIVTSDNQLKVADKFSGHVATWPADFEPEFQDKLKNVLVSMASN